MTENMLKMYVRNQIMLDPTYTGEEIIVKGERIKTNSIALSMQEGSKFIRGDGLLEMYIIFIRSCDEINMTVQGKKVPISEIMEGFKQNLPQKETLDTLVDKFMPFVFQYVSNHSCLGNGSILDDTLMVPNCDSDICNTALKHIFGCTNARFVYTLANKMTNGNTLDLHEDLLKKFNAATGKFLSYASLVRALGYPYSDYKQYISKGMLVSIDLSGLVYVILEDAMYCIRPSDFAEVSNRGLDAMPVCKKVYNTRDMAAYTQASLGGLR